MASHGCPFCYAAHRKRRWQVMLFRDDNDAWPARLYFCTRACLRIWWRKTVVGREP